MKIIIGFLSLTTLLFANEPLLEGCLDSKQKKGLEKAIVNLEKKLHQVLQKEMTAHAENLEAQPITETARKIYFDLRSMRTELMRSNSDQCRPFKSAGKQQKGKQ